MKSEHKTISRLEATDENGDTVIVSAGETLTWSGHSDKGEFFMLNGAELHVRFSDLKNIK